MSNERLVVVYVGDADTEQWLATSLQLYEGYVYRADELLSVLGMVVSYMPDLVVLDARTAPTLARQVYYHLRTIDAEPILILDHDSEDWDYPEYAQIRVITSFQKADLLAEIGDLTGTFLSFGEGAYHD